jgi:hypothetical protein
VADIVTGVDQRQNVIRLLKPQSDAEAAIMEAILSADAITPQSATTAAELGLDSSAALASLLERGTIRHTAEDPDRLFIPLYSRDLFLTAQQRRFMAIACGLAVIFTIFASVFMGFHPFARRSAPRSSNATIVH